MFGALAEALGESDERINVRTKTRKGKVKFESLSFERNGCGGVDLIVGVVGVPFSLFAAGAGDCWLSCCADWAAAGTFDLCF